MPNAIEHQSQWFFRALIAFLVAAPMILVLIAGSMPVGAGRGDLIVYGHEVILGAGATALLLEAMYAWGFSKAWKTLTLERKHSIAA